jgi:hypothetical protein
MVQINERWNIVILGVKFYLFPVDVDVLKRHSAEIAKVPMTS